MLAVDLIIILLSIIALWFGADWIVDSAARIARRVGISDLVIGLTVVAIGTSAPEFAVTGTAALQGQSAISVGNVVGSNIFNVGFILGSVALYRTVATSRRVVLRDGGILIASSLLLILFMADDLLRGADTARLESWEGGIMLAGLLGYLVFLMSRREVDAEEIPEGRFQPLDVVRLLAGLVLVVAGGRFLVDSSISVARVFGISEWAIAVTIVAFGTSAPEIATSFVAMLRGYADISVGNLIGSNLFNLLGVLGVASIIEPLTISDPGAWTSVLLMLGLMVLVVILMRTGWKLSRWEGGVLVVSSLIYIVGTVVYGG